MLKAKHYGADGSSKGEVNLPDTLFGAEPKEHVVWEAVKAFLANQRQGTASTKNKSKVSGGGRKPWRQKGTGRARTGSIRAAQWRGGYTVFGPKPRDYSTKLPKKMKRTAFLSVLSDRAQNGQVAIVDDFNMDEPKTRTVNDMITAMGIDDKKICLVTHGTNDNVFLSFRNLPHVAVLAHNSLNIFDLANAEVLVLTENALDGITEVFGA